MKFLYNCLILFLQTGVRIASIFNPKAKAFVHGRRNFFRTLENKISSKKGRKLIWVHCASLGEFEQGRPVMEALKRDFPEAGIFLTFFSPSGYEVRKNYVGADIVSYLPWDTRSNANRLIELVNPSLAIFVKYEFWYHYLHKLNTKSIPIISISAIFRPDQLFFKSYGGFYRNILRSVTHFFVQNESSLQMLRSIGIDQSSVGGDTRFDRVYQIVRQAEPVPIAEQFKNGETLMVVGSCWPNDFEIIAPFINRSSLKIIIAPHEIVEGFINTIEKELRVKSIRYSRAEKGTIKDAQVLIIDNIGMLNRLYRYGEFAYVGGAFGKGLHNILEAACFGLPVFFGNKSYQKYQEALDLIAIKSAFALNDTKDLEDAFAWLNQGANYKTAAENAARYVTDHIGATTKIVSYCRRLLS